MKLLQKSLLFASLLGIGAGVTSIPTITNSNITVQAATKKSSKTSSVKDLTSHQFYYRLSKDEFVKASDVKILTNDNQNSSGDVAYIEAEDFRLQVVPSKANLYNKDGKKLSRHLTQGTVCTIGSQDKFDESTYYQKSDKKLAQVNSSTTI